MAASSPFDAYAHRFQAISEKIETLQELANNHFGVDSESIHWGHVGDLERVDKALDELLAIFGAGQDAINPSAPAPAP